MHSVVGDAPVDSEATDFINFKICRLSSSEVLICRLSPSKVIIGVGFAYVCS